MVDALELLSVKVCQCNDDVVVASGSGGREVSLELEYTSEDEEEEFRMPLLRFFTLVEENQPSKENRNKYNSRSPCR